MSPCSAPAAVKTEATPKKKNRIPGLIKAGRKAIKAATPNLKNKAKIVLKSIAKDSPATMNIVNNVLDSPAMKGDSQATTDEQYAKTFDEVLELA